MAGCKGRVSGAQVRKAFDRLFHSRKQLYHSIRSKAGNPDQALRQAVEENSMREACAQGVSEVEPRPQSESSIRQSVFAVNVPEIFAHPILITAVSCFGCSDPDYMQIAGATASPEAYSNSPGRSESFVNRSEQA